MGHQAKAGPEGARVAVVLFPIFTRIEDTLGEFFLPLMMGRCGFRSGNVSVFDSSGRRAGTPRRSTTSPSSRARARSTSRPFGSALGLPVVIAAT